MLTIKTATGAVHNVLFCGVGQILGTLVFDMLDERKPVDIIAEFDDPENTRTIIYSDGRVDRVYHGYTRFEAYSTRGDGTVRISLAKEAQDNG